MTHKTFLIIGGGNMGTAIAEGLLRDNNNKIIIKDPLYQDHPFQKKSYGESVILTNSFDDISPQSVDFTILAVKPQAIINVLRDDLMVHFLENAKENRVVSVAAGTSYTTLKNALPKGTRLIRSMPNLPVAIGEGIFGYYAPEKQAEFEHSFSACGHVVYLQDEEMLHNFTALAGSGPAYIFHLIEALSIAAYQNGLPQKDAEIIARQTVIGSALFAQEKSNLSAETLRKNVTSPNGTTQAGLEGLMNNKDLNPEQSALTSLALKTLDLAREKSILLSKET